MKILIVDDEPLARSRLNSMVQELDNPYEIVGEAGNGEQAIHLFDKTKAHIILLDIAMPGMDGLEVAAHLLATDVPPTIIFTTAYDQYALQAFDAQALDYLLKPVRMERLKKTLNRACSPTKTQLAAVREKSGRNVRTQICARQRGELVLIPVKDILIFKADTKYISIFHGNRETLIEESLKALEVEFSLNFVRVHRNALIRKNCITALFTDNDGRHQVRIENIDATIEVSRRHLAEVKSFLKQKK